jgi:hypothetical protein
MPSCLIQLTKIAKLSIYSFKQIQHANNRQNNHIDGIVTLKGKMESLLFFFSWPAMKTEINVSFRISPYHQSNARNNTMLLVITSL